MTSLRQRMTEDMQVRNLALNTQPSYLQQVSLFGDLCHPRKRLDIDSPDVALDYILWRRAPRYDGPTNSF